MFKYDWWNSVKPKDQNQMKDLLWSKHPLQLYRYGVVMPYDANTVIVYHTFQGFPIEGGITILPDFGTFDDHTTKYVDSQLKSQPANVNYLILPRHRGKSLESPALGGFSEYFCRLPWRPSPGDLQWLINIPEIKRNLSGDIENKPCKECGWWFLHTNENCHYSLE